MAQVPPFAQLAAQDGPLDLTALALAAEFRPVDPAASLERLDVLGAEVRQAILGSGSEKPQSRPDPASELRACADVLHGEHGFAGDREHYDAPANSMIDVVLATRRGLPILLSVVYVEVARRAQVPLAGVGLAGHFVVAHFGTDPPLLADPFAGGTLLEAGGQAGMVRPWGSREIALRMLNNLVGSYQRRGNLSAAIHAAQLRLQLPAPVALRDTLRAELRALEARLN